MIDLLLKFKRLVFSRTAKDTSVLFLGNAISSLFGIAFTILAARLLGPENWGIVVAVMSLVAILVAYGDLGLSSGLFRFVSKLWNKGDKSKARVMQNSIFSLRVISALILMAILVLTSRWIAPFFFKIDNPMIAVLGAIGLFGALLIDFQIATFQSKSYWRRASIFIALTNFIRLLFLFLLITWGKLNILSLLSVFFCSSLLSLLLSFYYERPTFSLKKVWKQNFRKIADFSSWMGINRIVGATTSRMDVLLLLQLATSFETGILGSARQLANGIPIFIGSFATVIAPRFASYEKDDLKSFFRKTVLLSIIISFGVGLGIIAAKPIISLFGPKYTASISVFRWLLVAMIPFALATPAVNSLIYSFHKPKIIALLSIFQFPFVFFGNIYFIQRMGVFGPVLMLGLWNLSTLFVTYSFAWHFFRKGHK